MAKLGIDISSHNGDINLSALKSEIDFVIIRVGYGTKGTLDTKFKRNADLCKSLGIPFGFYWYSYALDVEGAKREADACLKAIEPYKNDYKMGVWFDMEDADGYKRKNGMPSNSMLRAICQKFCQTVEDAGYYCGIYASLSWFNNQLNGSEINRFDKWVAQWPTSGGYQVGLNANPNSKTGLNLWQFTSEARFKNHSGRLDANYAYRDNFIKETISNQPKKSVDEIAMEVINNQWGNGIDRKNRLAAAGYDYNTVQNRVNEILKGQKVVKKSVEEIAKEVINNQWGNGTDRKNRLTAAGYNYDEVQKKVNELLKKAPAASTYTVKKGDTLSTIAKQFGTTWNKIYNDNKNVIGSNPNLIKVGMKLTISK